MLKDLQAPTYLQWLEFLDLVPEDRRDEWARTCLRDKKYLHLWGRYVCPTIVKSHEIPDYQIELCQFFGGEKKISAAIVPRGFGKTTWERIDALHDICNELEPLIVFYGDTATDAQFHLESIKSEIENNLVLRRLYGDLVPANWTRSKKWTYKHIQTRNGVNMLARGVGKGRGINIKNKRPTKVYLDDVENDKQVRTKEGREWLSNWVMQTVIPSLDPERGKLRMIGTVLSKKALVLSFYRKFGGIFRKAIENGQSIWPAMFPLYRLYDEIKWAIGSRKFAQEYQNTPVNEELAIIKQAWIDRFSELPTAHLQKILMLDPQAGETENSDTFGLSVVGFYPKDAKRYVLSSISGKDTQLNQAILFIKTWQEDKKRFILCGIEKVLNQVAVFQLVQDWKKGKLHFAEHGIDDSDRNIPLIAVSPKGKDKTARLQMHEPAFERREIVFHITLDDLVDDFCSFPDVDNDDKIDSVNYCLEYSYRSISLEDDSENDSVEDETITGGLMKQKF